MRPNTANGVCNPRAPCSLCRRNIPLIPLLVEEENEEEEVEEEEEEEEEEEIYQVSQLRRRRNKQHQQQQQPLLSLQQHRLRRAAAGSIEELEQAEENLGKIERTMRLIINETKENSRSRLVPEETPMHKHYRLQLFTLAEETNNNKLKLACNKSTESTAVQTACPSEAVVQAFPLHGHLLAQVFALVGGESKQRRTVCLVCKEWEETVGLVATCKAFDLPGTECRRVSSRKYYRKNKAGAVRWILNLALCPTY